MGTQYVYTEPVERTDDDLVLHLFALINTAPAWSWMRDDIAVNGDGQISYAGSDWHGLAVFCFTPCANSWRLTFNPRAQPDRMQTLLFERIEDTHAFICSCDERRFNAVLIPKIVDWD